MTPIEESMAGLRKLLADPMWRSFDRLMNDVKVAEPYDDLVWLRSKRRVVIMALSQTLIEDFKFTKWTSAVGAEKVILTNELVNAMFRKAQAINMLAEQVLQWIELSRKKK